MANLIGKAPNQLPLNQFLGSMAWQDTKGVNIEGGSIDDTPVGANTASTGAFTSLTCTTLGVTSPTVPSSASDTGTAGTIAWDADFIYICTATDTWRRVAIATWP